MAFNIWDLCPLVDLGEQKWDIRPNPKETEHSGGYVKWGWRL